MPLISIKYKCDGCKKVFQSKKWFPVVIFEGSKPRRVYCSKCGKKAWKKIDEKSEKVWKKRNKLL